MRLRAALPLLLLLLFACRTQEQPARFAFLWVDAEERWQLFVAGADGEAAQLTFATGSIFDYDVAPGGKQIAYSLSREDGSRSLWQIAVADGAAVQLLDCPALLCQNPQWSADGARLLYERRGLDGDQPRLFWLDVGSGETLPVFDDETVLGYNGRLSHDDRYLSFVNIVAGVTSIAADDDHDHSFEGQTQPTVIFDRESGERLVVPNLMNSTAVWHPTAHELLLPDIQFFGEQIGSHLLHVDAETGTVNDRSVGLIVEDAAPDWSPDGSRVVFHRKLAATPMGRQIWLMNSDGSEARALSGNSDWHHGATQFSADGDSLLFQRFDISEPDGTPSIWLYDLITDEARQVVQAGSRPQWLR